MPDNMLAKTAADAAARLPERLRHDPAVFRAELPALITTVEGLAVVVNGARCHYADPRVQAAVLVALTPLMWEDWVKKENGQTGDSFELVALEAALAAMSAHAGAREPRERAAQRAVQAAACGMLKSLVSLVNFSPHATAIRAKFAELGGIARVIGAIDAFPRDRELVEDAVDALKNLILGDKAYTAQIIALGGMERVLMAMDNHPDGGLRVRFHAVVALQKMSEAGQDAQQRLAALGAAARVRAAMAAPDVYKGTTEYGKKLLARLPAVGLAQQEAAAAGSAGAASIEAANSVKEEAMLLQLAQMGFSDRSANKELLMELNFDMGAVIERLAVNAQTSDSPEPSSRGLFNWTCQDGQLASKSPATPLHTRSDGSQNSAGQTQRAQLTMGDLKKVQDVNTLTAFDPDATAGLGLTFSLLPGFNSQPCVTVSRVLESSAANFAGIMVGDVLLQIDDRIVSSVDDVKRCIGPYGSVVHLKFRRKTGNSVHWVSLIREIKASRKEEAKYEVRGQVNGEVKAIKHSNYIVKTTGAATSTVAHATNSGFLQEATNLVTSGSTLELRTESKSAQWKGVTVTVTTRGYLILDSQILGVIAYATLPPDAAADLQELQILNLQRRRVSWSLGSSAHKRDGSSVFLVYLKAVADYDLGLGLSGTTCDAYSQRGLFRVEMATHRLKFRASDAREANKWIKGINSVVSQFGFEGVRPSQQERQQILDGPRCRPATSLSDRGGEGLSVDRDADDGGAVASAPGCFFGYRCQQQCRRVKLWRLPFPRGSLNLVIWHAS
jgi:hypothetical protein